MAIPYQISGQAAKACSLPLYYHHELRAFNVLSLW